MSIKLAVGDTVDDGPAAVLYDAISEAVDELGPMLKLKFAGAFRRRPDWVSLDPDVQEVFRTVVRRIR